MTIYVDQLTHHHSGLWCHMMSDTNVDELVSFAASIGLKIEWLQDHPLRPHYDLRPSTRWLAVQSGAVEVSSRELAIRCSKLYEGWRNEMLKALRLIEGVTDSNGGDHGERRTSGDTQTGC